MVKRPPPTYGQSYSSYPGGGKYVAGPAEKKMVAEYARVHGAVAAARKFGINPPVSTYYQRKDSTNGKPIFFLFLFFFSSALIQPPLNTHMAQQIGQQPNQQSTPSTPTLPNNLAGSPGPSSEGENDGNDRKDTGPPVLQPATPNHPHVRSFSLF